MHKKFYCILLSLIFLLSGFDSIAQTDIDKTNYFMGATPNEEKILWEHLDKNMFQNIALEVNSYLALPSSVDLSVSPYFPPIQNQMIMNSCAAFSTTYYQFTYEKNKLHRVPSDTPDTWASPKWTYNMNNKGINGPINETKAYSVLSKCGAVSWEQFPYMMQYDENGNLEPEQFYELPTNLADVREAMGTRINANWSTYIIPGAGTPITSATDSDLTAIKTLLNNGKVLVIDTWMNWQEKVNGNGEIISYRCYRGKDNEGHSMTLVGYDDNITCDVNRNGTIEPSERGAFKVANSWGEDYNNNGYLWVLYDALNEITAIPGGWESSLSSDEKPRKPAFSMDTTGGTNNWFYGITVEDKPIYFVAEVTATAQEQSAMSLTLQRLDAAFNTTSLTTSYRAIGGNNPYTGTMAIDFGTLVPSIQNYCFGFEWGLKVTDLGAFNSSGNKMDSLISNIWVKITDNLGNTIQNVGNIPNVTRSGGAKAAYAPIDLDVGDIDYDGSIDSVDALSVLNYNVGKETFSDLQLYLADYDGNGVIDATDAQGILSHGVS